MLVAAGFVIFRRVAARIQFLLLHASSEENLWSPPKGHLDPGEEEMEAAYRETMEEAALPTSALRIVNGFVKELNYYARGKPKRVVYWLAELIDPETPVVISDEHRDFKWVELDEAKALARFPDLQEVLDDSFQFLTRSE